MMESPANQVFHTYELLENVMIHCSMIDLYALQVLNRTFRNITQSSPRIKAVMDFPQHPDAPSEKHSTKSTQLWIEDVCHGRGLTDQEPSQAQGGPEARINPIMLHICKWMEVVALVQFDGPLFRLSGDPHSNVEMVLREKYCKLKLYTNSTASFTKAARLQRILKGPSGPFLMRSWMTNFPMDIECRITGIGETRLEQLKFQAIVGKHEATVGKLLSVLLEYLDVVRANWERGKDQRPICR